MITFDEDEFLRLSGIQHFEFCRRQWALIHIESQWAENVRTIEGNLIHNKAHDELFREKRGNTIICRSLVVSSRVMGISGQCDVVEFHKNKNGIPIIGEEGNYEVIPIEYKKGRPKTSSADILQLCAEAMCLEEMLCCEIPFGYIYYHEIRHREKVIFTKEIREKVISSFEEMHKCFKMRHTPKVKRTKSCNACSLKDICLPVLEKQKSALKYISSHIEGDIE